MIPKTRWFATTALAASACISLSCAHTPDPHVHLSAPAPPFEKPLIVQGQVVDAVTREPVSYADVYVIDARHENWSALEQHNALLGTANRAGVVDLAATLKVADSERFGYGFRSGFGGWNATQALIEAAEVRCREGKPPSVAVVLAAPRYQDALIFPEAPLRFDESRGGNVLQLNTVAMTRRPESDYTLVNSVLEAQEEVAE